MNATLPRMAMLTCATLLLAGATDETRFATPPSSPRFHKPAQNVLFADDFSDGDLGGWTPDQSGVWSIWRGMLRADLPDQKQLRSLISTGDTTWTDIAVDLDMCMMRGVDKGVIVRVTGESGTGVDVRGGSYQDVVMYQGSWPMGRASTTNANGTWNHLRVEARANRYRVFVNGEQRLDKTDGRAESRGDPRSAKRAGRIALPAYTGGVGQCTVYYDNVVVTALK
jgi:3-keto-disaccharide hydrolase